MSDKQDLGPPIAYLVLKTGTAVYDRSGAEVGTVAHVLDDDGIFVGLVIDTDGHGHRFAASDVVDGLYEHGVIIASKAAELPEPRDDQDAGNPLKRAWDWLIEPR